MNQIGLFRNENVQVPEPIAPATRHWEYVTVNTDRTKPFTKYRCTMARVIVDFYFSSIPNVNADGKNRSQLQGATYGYAGKMGLGYYINAPVVTYPRNGIWTDYESDWDSAPINVKGTYVGTGLDGSDEYEYEMGAPFYWAGVGNTAVYTSYPYKLQIYVE